MSTQPPPIWLAPEGNIEFPDHRLGWYITFPPRSIGRSKYAETTIGAACVSTLKEYMPHVTGLVPSNDDIYFETFLDPDRLIIEYEWSTVEDDDGEGEWEGDSAMIVIPTITQEWLSAAPVDAKYLTGRQMLEELYSPILPIILKEV